MQGRTPIRRAMLFCLWRTKCHEKVARMQEVHHSGLGTLFGSQFYKMYSGKLNLIFSF
jgi:hypothetical protein